MKRNIILAAAIAAISLGASAQTASESTATPRVGVTASWDLNAPSTSFNDPTSIYQNGSGFSAGVFCDIPMWRGFYIEPGVKFFYNTMIIDPQLTVEDLLKYDDGILDGSLRNYGLRVPVKVGYEFVFAPDISLSVFTGPQVNVGFGFKAYNNRDDSSFSLYGKGWNRCDAQWLFGVRFKYADNWFADIEGGIGMTNMLKGDNYPGQHFRRNTFAIGVGYIF